MTENNYFVLLEKKMEEIKAMISELLDQNKNIKEPIYDNQQVMKLLNIGDKLIKNYRDEGLIGYSHKGDKYWYRKEDINSFLSNIHYEAYAQKQRNYGKN